MGRIYDPVIVASDTRTTNEAVKYAFISGLLAAGAHSHDAGVLPTPTLAFAARGFKAGAVITASHNPPEYNGIKILNPDGSAFDTKQQEELEALIADDSLPCAPWQQIGGSWSYPGAINQHIERILSLFPAPLGIKIALDCSCGAASTVTPYLLQRLGCEVIGLNCNPSGFFPHNPEPTEASLGDLMTLTREAGAALGIAHDGDADRMMAVDDRGRFIPGDKLLGIFARALGASNVVTTVDASMAIEEMGLNITRTPVGDNYVSRELKKGGGFGGEPSGAWVFPTISLCPDGIFAAAQVAAIASREKLSRLANDLPAYPIRRGSIAIDGKSLSATTLEARLSVLKPSAISRTDGIRLDFGDAWLLVRASGTEPRLRLTAEAKTETRLREIYDAAEKAINDRRELT